MQNNPNMIDSLFTRPNCELIVTDIGRKVKDNRKIFLHKGAWHRFKGYAFSQLNKIRTNKKPSLSGIIKFEQEHDISTKISFDKVAKEIRKRGLL